MPRVAFLSCIVVLISCSLLAERATLVSSESYELPAWKDAADSTDVEKYADREEYERAAADSRYELRRLKLTSDGLVVTAYAYAPRSWSSPRPTIVFNRGSWVRGDIGPELLPMFHRLAEEGFAIIAPLYRGSDGAAGKDEMGGADLADLMIVAPLVAELPWARADALFLYGESRGGMMVFQAIRDDFPARAAATFGGFTDLGALLEQPRWAGAGNAIWPDLDERRAEIVERRSALAWPEAIDIPILLMHGSDDGAVSPAQTLELGLRLTELERSFGMIIFEGDDHVLSGNNAARDRAAAEFFRRHMP